MDVSRWVDGWGWGLVWCQFLRLLACLVEFACLALPCLVLGVEKDEGNGQMYPARGCEVEGKVSR